MLHPEATFLVLTRQLPSFGALAPVDTVLEVLVSAGCPDEEAVHILRALVAMLIGTLLREVQAGPTLGTTNPQDIARPVSPSARATSSRH